MNNLQVDESPKSGINTNSYATKKTVSQGLFDVALLTANASQLKYSLQLGDKNKFYLVIVVLICTSIILQVLVGVLFIYQGLINLNEPNRQKRLNIINNLSTIMVFVITVINVFISGFGFGNDQSSSSNAWDCFDQICKKWIILNYNVADNIPECLRSIIWFIRHKSIQNSKTTHCTLTQPNWNNKVEITTQMEPKKSHS